MLLSVKTPGKKVWIVLISVQRVHFIDLSRDGVDPRSNDSNFHCGIESMKPRYIGVKAFRKASVTCDHPDPPFVRANPALPRLAGFS
jgi:hypothetical protein